MPRTAQPAYTDPGESRRAPSFFDDDMLAEELEGETPTAPSAAQPESTPEPEPQPEPEPSRPIDFQVDQVALANAHGDPGVWAHQFGGLIHAITGQFIDDETLAGWLAGFGRQVAARTYRDALFQVANTPLPPHPQGDPAFLLLQLRDEIARGFRGGAGVL